MKYLWISTTTDKYELITYVADSRQELADKLNITPDTISSAISKGFGGKVRGVKFEKISIDNDFIKELDML